MSVKRIVNLPTISGWQGGNGAAAFGAHTIVCDVPVGPRYHVIWIGGTPGSGKFWIDTNGTNGLLAEIRVKVNGKVQRQITADELNRLNILNGVSFAAKGGATATAECWLPIWFAEPWRQSVSAADGLAWATGDVSSFQIEVDIRAYAAAAAGLSVPRFVAEVDNSLVTINGVTRQQPMGAIVKMLPFQLPVAQASSWHDYTGLPKRDFYQSIHLFDANIDEFEVKVDNSVVRQATVIQNQYQLFQRGMFPAPSATATPGTVAADLPTRNIVDIVFDHDDLLNSALPMAIGGQRVQDFNLRVRTGSGGTVPRNIKTIVQLIGPAE